MATNHRSSKEKQKKLMALQKLQKWHLNRLKPKLDVGQQPPRQSRFPQIPKWAKVVGLGWIALSIISVIISAVSEEWDNRDSSMASPTPVMMTPARTQQSTLPSPTEAIRVNPSQLATTSPTPTSKELTAPALDASMVRPTSPSMATMTRQYKWKYGGSEWTYTANIPQAIYEYYAGIPRPPTPNYSVYVTHAGDDLYIQQLVKNFKDAATSKGFNEFQTVNFAVSFVQSLPYTFDVTKGYDEYPRYPIETLVDNGGDCEDTSILMAAILKEMGYGVILISPPNHMAVGVLGGEGMYGTYWELNERKYYYLETTGDGLQIGELPSEYKGVKAKVYELIPVPILTTEWDAARTHFSFPQWYLELDVKVENQGTATARGLYLNVAFDAGNDKVWNPKDGPVFDLAPGYRQTFTMRVAIPRREHTRLIVTIVQDGLAVSRDYSKWFDT